MNIDSTAAVQMVKRAHKLKTKVKKICRQMDEIKSNEVKPDVFFSILKITNIKIPNQVEQELKKLYVKDGMINYKDALGRISINHCVSAPLNKDWVMHSNQSSMHSTVYSVCNSRPMSIQPKEGAIQKVIPNKSVVESNKYQNSDGEKSVKMNEDIKSEYVPYPKPSSQNKIFNRSARSSFSTYKRGVTPARNLPIKLSKPVKNMHETDFNIITNRDKQNSPSTASPNPRIITQAERDYQDYTKSEFSFEYTKNKGFGDKKFSNQRIVRKYSQFYDKKKDREVPQFVKDLLADHKSLAELIDEVYSLKATFEEFEI